MHEHESEGSVYSKWHLVIMALCCLIPIVILVIIVYANIESPYLPFVLILLCPLLMIIMHLLPMLFRKPRKEENHYSSDAKNEISSRRVLVYSRIG